MHTRAKPSTFEQKASIDSARVEALSDIIDQALIGRDRWYSGPTYVSVNGPHECLRGVRVNFAQIGEIERIYHGWVVETYYNAHDHGLKFTRRNR